ncbi:unnamed protein product [Caenorhabditis brenneri]
MFSFIKFALFIAVFAVVAFQGDTGSFFLPITCSVQQQAVQPCFCCRRSCWVGIAQMTTKYFGNIPGERNDAEAMFALSMMRKCMENQCHALCSAA